MRYAELTEIDHMYHEGELLDLDVGPLRKKCEDEIQAMYLLPIRKSAAHQPSRTPKQLRNGHKPSSYPPVWAGRMRGGDLYLRALGQKHPVMEAYVRRTNKLKRMQTANLAITRLIRSATRVIPAPAAEEDITGGHAVRMEPE